MNTIKTARLSFRDIQADDLDNLVALYGCPETMKHISQGHTLTREQNEQKLAALLKDKEDAYPQGIWAAEHTKTGEFVGWFLLKMFPNVKDPGIGYSIVKKFRGKGYASEGSAALVKHSFQEANLEKVSAITSPENQKSIDVLLRMGFDFEGVISTINSVTKETVQSNLYGMTQNKLRSLDRIGTSLT